LQLGVEPGVAGALVAPLCEQAGRRRLPSASMSESADRDRFRAFEHEGWQRVAGRYAEAWARLTGLFVAPLVELAAVGPGLRLLDVACGPGPIAAAAAAAGATAVGLDFSAAMVEEARRLHPGIEFREGDAEALPFADASFERVTMGFGVVHLADPDRAFAEARRVLRPGGRLAFSGWAPPAQSPGARIMEEAVAAHADREVELPAGPPYFRFADREECRRALALAGFAPGSVRHTTLTRVWTLPTAEFFFAAERDAGVRTAAVLARQSPARLARIRDAVAAGVSRYPLAAGGFGLPMTAYLVAATVEA
jgi:SAM-dependent methyltransferase